jgi:hypothetical protein
MHPSTALKLSGGASVVLCAAYMLWSGSLELTNAVVLTLCGAACGYLWYLAADM